MFSWLRKRPAAVETITFNSQSVSRRRTSGETESVRWQDLQEVSIITTDQGPFVDDLFWVLIGREGGCLAPSQANGTPELVERLQQLPGFDNEAVLQAMQSTQNDKFLVWKQTAAFP